MALATDFLGPIFLYISALGLTRYIGLLKLQISLIFRSIVSDFKLAERFFLSFPQIVINAFQSSSSKSTLSEKDKEKPKFNSYRLLVSYPGRITKKRRGEPTQENIYVFLYSEGHKKDAEIKIAKYREDDHARRRKDLREKEGEETKAYEVGKEYKVEIKDGFFDTDRSKSVIIFDTPSVTKPIDSSSDLITFQFVCTVLPICSHGYHSVTVRVLNATSEDGRKQEPEMDKVTFRIFVADLVLWFIPYPIANIIYQIVLGASSAYSFIMTGIGTFETRVGLPAGAVFGLFTLYLFGKNIFGSGRKTTEGYKNL